MQYPANFLCSSNTTTTAAAAAVVVATLFLVIKLHQSETFFAVHAFGDSVLDTGNNNLKTISKCNFTPYGRDFSEGKPTGNWKTGLSNGYIFSLPLIFFFAAEALAIKEEMPSYHDPNLQRKDLQTGLSFASGCSGYDPLTSQLLLRKLHYDVPSYTDLLLRWASNFLRDLYKLGARKVAVFNVAPLGCLPFARTLGGGIIRKCVEKINQAVQMFNANLSSELASLDNELHDSNFVFVDIYNPVLDLIQEPSKFGE
ncbi:GDSL esterase/lipase EXL3 [Morus notabilis]|uniref:GDSL esterase/lipase EXL3 n=1 Tax=Morus notabilis TaxID=981085 RepID=W9RR63_9ROSA|nr:GDSL esterase/lipase EXL3 [Morus notabilis]